MGGGKVAEEGEELGGVVIEGAAAEVWGVGQGFRGEGKGVGESVHGLLLEDAVGGQVEVAGLLRAPGAELGEEGGMGDVAGDGIGGLAERGGVVRGGGGRLPPP